MKARVAATPYNLARQGTLRRRLAIPHPIFYANLCHTLERYSGVLERRIRDRVLPNPKSIGRAFVSPLVDEKIVEAHARVRATFRFLLITDIAQCYHSIYTHTLGWVLGGKEQAKTLARTKNRAKTKRRNQAEYAGAFMGDELDRAIRDMQDGQSVGLPIGPDASRIVAEILLCDLDDKLEQALKEQGIRAEIIRNTDDYQVGVSTYTDAEKVLATLQRLLHTELQLALNPLKTRILVLPAPLEDSWVTQLKGIFREGSAPDRQKRRDLLRIFDTAVAMREQFPNEHVFRYMLGILKKQNVGSPNWPLLQQML